MTGHITEKLRPARVKRFFVDALWAKRTRFGKAMVSLGLALLIMTSAAYGVAQWYIIRHADEPLKIGTSFSPRYAREFGLDPQETLQAVIDDLGIRRFRLMSYWNDYEPAPDEYDFADLDWQFDMIEAAGGEISLAMGLRQPRWPECHGPQWALEKPVEQWAEDLKEYMGVVIERYKDRAVLVEYQLENEFFLEVFGICPDFSRERLVDEYNHVKALDPARPITVSRSNNATPSWPVGDPQPDIVAASVYKRIWDKTLTKRYVEYPYPAWFYAFLAGATEITTGQPSIIHELQTEAWLPEGFDKDTAPIDEIYKSLSPERLRHRINYGVATGIRTIDLWGVEWWYDLKTQRDAPELWNTAREELAQLHSD